MIPRGSRFLAREHGGAAPRSPAYCRWRLAMLQKKRDRR
jgi:hypothetical protein